MDYNHISHKWARLCLIREIKVQEKGRCIMNNFCEKCGTELIDGVCPKCVQSENKAASRYEGKFKNFFMSPKEKLVAVLGNSYIENFLHNGSVEKGFAVVSDKRVYFQGNNYYISYDAKGKKKVIRNQQSRTVDLKDVTGTGTDSYVNTAWFIRGCVVAVLMIIIAILVMGLTQETGPKTVTLVPGNSAMESHNNSEEFAELIGGLMKVIAVIFLPVFCFFKYHMSAVSLITIQYAGGVIGFDINWFTQQEIDLFQKQLRVAKDKAIEASDNAVANKLQEAVSNMTQSVSAPNSKADELTKLVDLLQKGIIAQEEFEKMKKELI